MKKRFIFPSLLLGTLLALPGANAQTPTYTADDLDITGHDSNYEYNVVLDPTDNATWGKNGLNKGVVGTWNGTDAFTPLAGPAVDSDSINGNVYNIGNIVGTTTKNSLGSSGVVFTTDATGRFTFGNITLKGNQTNGYAGSELHGISFNNVSSFTGTLNVGDITITGEKNSGSYSGHSFGISFLGSSGTGGSGWSEIKGMVDVGTIDIEGMSGTGFVAGSIGEGANVNIDKIKLNMDGTGNGKYAIGVEIADHNGANGTDATTGNIAAGTFYIGEIDVIGASGAGGFRADGGIGGDSTATIGKMTVKGHRAYGVSAQNDATEAYADISGLTLTGNVDVESTATSGGTAVAVAAKNADVKIDGNVKITTTVNGVEGEGAAFVTTDATAEATGLNLTLTEGSVLDTTASGGVDSKGAFVITGGTFNSGVVNAASYTGNNTIINISDADLAASIIEEDDENGNQIYNLNNTKVKILSDAKITADDITGITVNATGNSAVIVNKTQEVVFDANGDVSLKMAEAPIAGGYVNAMRMHHNYTTWNAVGSHLLSNIGAPTSGGNYRGQECDPCDPIGACDPCGSLGSTVARTAWVNYVARSNEYGDLFGGTWDFDSEGVQFGTDLYRTKRGQLGVLFGYEDGRMRNSLFGDRMENENYYIGLYGSRIFRNGWDVRGSFSYGWQDYNMNRFDNVGAVTDQYASAFDGNTTEATVEIGKRFFRGNWSLRPVLGVDVFTNETDAAQETVVGTTPGGSATTYLENSLTQAFIRTGADLTWQRKRLAFNAGLFYSYDMHGEDLVTAIDIEGAERGQLTGTALGRELLSWNVGTKVAVAKNLDIFGGYRGESILDDGDGDGINNTGYIGAAWKW